MMIEINLLPEELRRKEPKFKAAAIDFSQLNLQSLPVLKIGGATLAVLVAIQIMLFLVGIYMKSQLNANDKHYRELLPKKKEADLLKNQVEVINKKVGAIDELMVKRFSWARKLNELSDSMTPGIWLTELSYSEKVIDKPMVITMKGAKNKAGLSKTVIEKALVKYLLISGYAASLGEDGTAAVGKFIKSLKDNPDFYADFSDIELGAIKREKIDPQEVMAFRITCLFKEVK